MTTLPPSLAPRWRWPLRIALALSGWLALAATLALPDAGVPRLLIICSFLLLCPGFAATRWARPTPWHDRGWPFFVETALLAVALSLCLGVLAVEPFYLTESFTTTRVIVALAVMTSLLALLPTPGTRRPGARPTAPDDAPSAPGSPPDPAADAPPRPGAATWAVPGDRPHRRRPSGRPGDRGPLAVTGAGPYGSAIACPQRAARVRSRVSGQVRASRRARPVPRLLLERGEGPFAALVVLAAGAVPRVHVTRTLWSPPADAPLPHQGAARPTVVAHTPAVPFDSPPLDGTGGRSRLPKPDAPLGHGHPRPDAGRRNRAVRRRLPAPLRRALPRVVTGIGVARRRSAAVTAGKWR
ncbi:hypothetical protein AB0K68_05465 [Streptomyces sp. NPDC050698]